MKFGTEIDLTYWEKRRATFCSERMKIIDPTRGGSQTRILRLLLLLL